MVARLGRWGAKISGTGVPLVAYAGDGKSMVDEDLTGTSLRQMVLAFPREPHSSIKSMHQVENSM
jgi:hypothetical protein